MKDNQEFAGKIAFALTEAVQLIPRISSIHVVKINVNNKWEVTVKNTDPSPAEKGMSDLLESMTGRDAEMVCEFSINCKLNKK